MRVSATLCNHDGKVKKGRVCLDGFVDGHCDTIVKLFHSGEKLRRNKNHLDLERLFHYNGSVQVFALWLDPVYYPIALRQTLKYLDFYQTQIAQNLDFISHVESYEDIVQNQKQGRLSALLSIEGGESLEGEIAVLRLLYQLGVRMMGLTWNYRNSLADGVRDRETGGGLTAFGKSVVQEMNRLGMIVDVSHLSDRGFYDVAHIAEAPFIASHSNSRVICDMPRNLTDDQLRILAEFGGGVGINYYPVFVSKKKTAEIEDLIQHISHILDVAGENCIGFGSDFDGIHATPKDLRRVEDMEIFLDRLHREFGKEVTAKIREKNFHRVFRQVLGNI